MIIPFMIIGWIFVIFLYVAFNMNIDFILNSQLNSIIYFTLFVGFLYLYIFSDIGEFILNKLNLESERIIRLSLNIFTLLILVIASRVLFNTMTLLSNSM